uniref:Phosphatidic acid phosphatase type 2/haloperoxidase domain-containing protein n=2 Tax=Corethron hystrix TaxID=216773 RepID=A0A7S1BQY2_9STRA|mmetsp:Transcript_37958/g.88316  ORF Transcript_37958/g.88316 Transcript_37958/m.88316 type:complete len:190 (+) Transcript_37958:393-962(+)
MFALFVRGKKIDLHRTWCAHTSALGTTLCVTEVLKRYVGRLRPNTYEYCGFSLELLRCTDTDDDWAKSFPTGQRNWAKSFPSGHASVSFCGCVLLVWYLRSSANVKYQHTFVWRIWALISLSPLALAIMIAASRVADYYHFVGDVVAGSIIGACNALIFSRIHFPSQNLITPPETNQEEEEALDPFVAL